MNPFNSNSRQAIALITGKPPSKSTLEPLKLTPRTSAVIIFKILKVMRAQLKYFPHFEELSKDVPFYHPHHGLCVWEKTDWKENHPGRILKAKESSFPLGIQGSTRVIGLYRMWSEDKMILLTKKGDLLLLDWVSISNTEPYTILSASIKVFTFWDLVRLIKDSRAKEPHFQRIWRENIIKDSLASLLEEHLNAKRTVFENAFELDSEVTAILSRIS